MGFQDTEVIVRLEPEGHVYTVVWVLWRVSCVAGNVKDRAHDGYIRRIRRVGTCSTTRSISHNLVLILQSRYLAVVPSHLAKSPRLIGSSLGGLSFGGSLGAKFLGSWTCSVSAMADVYGN